MRPSPLMSKKDSKTLAETIVDLCVKAGEGKSICPMEAAKSYAAARNEGELGWRNHLSDVRRTAKKLANEGALVILRKGKPADPSEVRGVIRLTLPSHDKTPASSRD